MALYTRDMRVDDDKQMSAKALARADDTTATTFAAQWASQMTHLLVTTAVYDVPVRCGRHGCVVALKPFV